MPDALPVTNSYTFSCKRDLLFQVFESIVPMEDLFTGEITMLPLVTQWGFFWRRVNINKHRHMYMRACVHAHTYRQKFT